MLAHVSARSIIILPALCVLCTSCSDPSPNDIPVRKTPIGAKVDLSGISISISEIKLTEKTLSFSYTLDNQSGSHLAFDCIYPNSDDLIVSHLSDGESETIGLGKNPDDGLTLTAPRPLQIRSGKTTRTITVPLGAQRKFRPPLKLHVRFHAPSRYDELRSTITAPPALIEIPANLLAADTPPPAAPLPSR